MDCNFNKQLQMFQMVANSTDEAALECGKMFCETESDPVVRSILSVPKYVRIVMGACAMAMQRTGIAPSDRTREQQTQFFNVVFEELRFVNAFSEFELNAIKMSVQADIDAIED